MYSVAQTVRRPLFVKMYHLWCITRAVRVCYNARVPEQLMQFGGSLSSFITCSSDKGKRNLRCRWKYRVGGTPVGPIMGQWRSLCFALLPPLPSLWGYNTDPISMMPARGGDDVVVVKSNVRR